MPKREYKGEGLAFYNLVKKSGKKIDEVQSELDIANGTLYNYYNSEILPANFVEKLQVWAKEFGEIFKTPKDTITTNAAKKGSNSFKLEGDLKDIDYKSLVDELLKRREFLQEIVKELKKSPD